ncbi:MAG: hypothetical protein KGY99_07065 [Phycisphaerae bacterium]|nr:hypothetical protein [Phycisphaerae bacterium]
MTKAYAVWIAAMALPATAATAQIDEASTTDKPSGANRLDTLVERIETNAQRWLAGKGEDPSVATDLEQVVYDADSVPALQRHLTANRMPPVNLYVADKLLEPLLRAKAEVIAAVMPRLQGLLRACRTRPFPKHDEAYYERLKLPDEGETSDERMMARITHIEQRRRQKLDTDWKIARHNAASARLIRTIGKLMLYADETRYDRQFVDLLRQQQHHERQSFFALLEALKAEIPELPKERAQVYYDAIKPLAMELRYVRMQYKDYTEPYVNVTGPSTYTRGHRQEHPGIRLLETLNILAPKAGRPALNVPTEEEVKKVLKQMEQRRKR